MRVMAGGGGRGVLGKAPTQGLSFSEFPPTVMQGAILRSERHSSERREEVNAKCTALMEGFRTGTDIRHPVTESAPTFHTQNRQSQMTQGSYGVGERHVDANRTGLFPANLSLRNRTQPLNCHPVMSVWFCWPVRTIGLNSEHDLS